MTAAVITGKGHEKLRETGRVGLYRWQTASRRMTKWHAFESQGGGRTTMRCGLSYPLYRGRFGPGQMTETAIISLDTVSRYPPGLLCGACAILLELERDGRAVDS